VRSVPLVRWISAQKGATLLSLSHPPIYSHPADYHPLSIRSTPALPLPGSIPTVGTRCRGIKRGSLARRKTPWLRRGTKCRRRDSSGSRRRRTRRCPWRRRGQRGEFRRCSPYPSVPEALYDRPCFVKYIWKISGFSPRAMRACGEDCSHSWEAVGCCRYTSTGEKDGTSHALEERWRRKEGEGGRCATQTRGGNERFAHYQCRSRCGLGSEIFFGGFTTFVPRAIRRRMQYLVYIVKYESFGVAVFILCHASTPVPMFLWPCVVQSILRLLHRAPNQNSLDYVTESSFMQVCSTAVPVCGWT